VVLEKEASALVQLVLAAVVVDLHPTEANVLVHPADSVDHLLADLPLAAEAAATAKIAATNSKFCTQIFVLTIKVRQFSSEFSIRHLRAGGDPGWPNSEQVTTILDPRLRGDDTKKSN
jgi:hypothetical protein